MQFKNGFILVAFISLLSLVACGGSGDGDGGGQGNSERQGRFVDSAVQGMRYVATPSGKTGTTDISGTFYYEAGDSISFYIGDILIGTTGASPVITPVSLVPGAVDESNTTVQNVARFLQTLDENGSAVDGINIPSAVYDAAAGKTLNFSSADFDSEVTVLLNEIFVVVGITPPMLVNASDAALHLADTLLSSRQGMYSGSWVQTAGSSTDGGVWYFNVDSSGNITGCATSMGSSMYLTGTVGSNGDSEIANGATSTGVVFSGTIGLDGVVSGSWTNTGSGASGTYTGSPASSAPISCPDIEQPSYPTPNPAPTPSYGSLTISGVDAASLGASFTPESGELNMVGTTGSVPEYTWIDDVTSSLADGSSIKIAIIPNLPMTQIDFIFSTVSGISVHYGYSLQEFSDSVVSVDEVGQTVTFSNVILQPDTTAPGSATDAITLDGILSYDIQK